MGGGIKEKTSSGGYPTIKIVLERCPRTEKALAELQNYHHHHHLAHCCVCGGNEELIDLQNYAWTPLQSQLFKKRVLEWTLEVSASGGGRGGDGLTTHDDDEVGWSCEWCMTQFEMLALVQSRIADLENQEKEIVSQLKKAIGDRLGVISQPNSLGIEPEVTTSFILDVDENPSLSTPMMTDSASDEGEDLDLKPVILEDEFMVEDTPYELPVDDGVEDGPGDDTIGGAGLIADEEMMKHSDQGGIVDEDRPRRIEGQLKKIIGDRLGVISHPNLPGTEPEVTTSFILNVDEDPSKSTPMMTDAPSDEDFDLDLNPVILEEGVLVDEVQDQNPLQSQPDDDADDGLCEDTISEEEMNHADQGGTVEEDQPGPNKSRRVRTTQVRADILPNKDEIDDDDENDEYSPTIESDTDSNEQNESGLGPHIGKERDDRNGNGGGMPSNPSTSVRKGDDKHICEVCGKQVVNLSQHMEIHRSDRQTFSCETCHKTFSTEGSLSRHRNDVHLKQLPHKCQKCGKGFCHAQNLQRHLKTRIPCTELSKKKKFLCPICKCGFTNKSNLQCHTRAAHNGEKRTKCPHSKCNYHYFDKTKLELHLKIHHSPDEPLS